ncbi:MAG: VOC family protein [Pseudomonadota bacterium]
MQRVLGIGGVFFRAKDPDHLRKWYQDNLGVTEQPRSYEAECWRQNGGDTVFAPFNHDTDYFGRPEQQWMLNFRVSDLDAMAEQLRGNGIAVEVDPETHPNGRFARLYDPEGNPIELWQPSGASEKSEENVNR